VQLTEQDLIMALEEGPVWTPPLSRIVTGDSIMDLLSETPEEVQEVLITLLPEGRQTAEELLMTLRSPQMRQTLVQLSKALSSESHHLVVANLGLDPRDGERFLLFGDGIGAFIAAIEAEAEREERRDNFTKKQ